MNESNIYQNDLQMSTNRRDDMVLLSDLVKIANVLRSDQTYLRLSNLKRNYDRMVDDDVHGNETEIANLIRGILRREFPELPYRSTYKNAGLIADHALLRHVKVVTAEFARLIVPANPFILYDR